MGLFSGKTTINVSSTLYNMAGDEADRPDFLKGTLFGAVMADSSSLADDIVSSYFSGPGISQRLFFNYAVRNNLAGIPNISVSNTTSVDPVVVANEIPLPVSPPAPATLNINVQNATVRDGDPEPFLERWILDNHPTRIIEAWTGDVNGQNFSVQFPNGDFFSFVDTEYDVSARYIISNYFLTVPDVVDPLIEGAVVSVLVLPSFTNFISASVTPSFIPLTLIREMVETRTYSDGRPDEVDTALNADIGANLDTSVTIHDRTKIIDASFYEVASQYQKYTHTGTDSVVTGYSDSVVTEVLDIGAGVIRTTTQVTTGEDILVSWDEKYDTQEITDGAMYGIERRFIYKVGTGNANLDALATAQDASNFQEFFPFLPLRLNNVSILDNVYANVDNTLTEPDPLRQNDPPYGNGLFTETSKAYRRATTKSLTSLVDEIEANPDIGDIDYAYMMYGCSLNVQDNSARKYIYNFFLEMRQFQTGTSTTMSAFQTAINDYDAAIADFDAWSVSMNTLPDEQRYDNPLPQPVIPSIGYPAITTLKLKTNSPLMPSYDMRLNWVFIDEVQVAGQYTFNPLVGVPRNAKKDELQFEDGSVMSWSERVGVQERDFDYFQNINHSIPSIKMYWQVDENNYRVLTIYGLVHQNFIYGGKAVTISSSTALADTDISGFIVPLHYPTMKAMSIVDYTQIATADTHILFNSYTVTKKKWYQTGLFKIILIIVIIALIVIIAPAGFTAAGGLLGGNAAIGAALGLSGTAALVAGVVANYLASLIISQILSIVGSALLGEKWGAIFASIVGLVLSMGLSGVNILSAQGILGLGNAAANGYAGFVQGEIGEMNADLQAESEQYEQQMKYINDLLNGLSGNDLNFNPLSLTDTLYGNGRRGSGGGYTPETSDEFIRRTTMTGSDIVDITHSMVYDFVEVQRTLPRN